ncbi:MAG: glycoside hydrolase family 13 protein [Bacteroidales bacterium]|nr:glycoside hydrolase family 13 protein [Bacteroidales bacterium]
MKKYPVLLFLISFWFLINQSGFAGNDTNITIEPPNWWTGMKNPDLQLMVHGKDISLTKAVINYAGVELVSQISVQNPNYVFLNLKLKPEVKPGTFQIKFMLGKKEVFSVEYELEKRNEGSADRKGFDNKDAIYLIMPDRFANGDPSNDSQDDMLEKADRANPNGRHGGDIKGVSDHLDYLADLGVTAVWLTPVLENNAEAYSYHGYAITDFYRVDPRHGTNEEYAAMVENAHSKGLKVIMDMVFNHYGTGHKWTNDLPMHDWVNEWPEFTRSNYRGGSISDPYAAESDRNQMSKGWFDGHMADLNASNPFVETYLIQNSIWWVEFAGLDGIRQDTYPYSNKFAMAKWMKALHDEYQYFSVVGEVWLNYPSQVAYWQEDAKNADGYNSNLDFVMDFPLKSAIGSAFNEQNGWDKGILRLYESLSQDFLYSHPDQIVDFADNHDGDRIYSVLGEDKLKMKMAMTFLLTVRGLPQLYYSSEVLSTGFEHQGHGFIRKDFPGGWQGDQANVFLADGRNTDQNEVFNHIRTLLNFRKSNEVLQNGKMKHYLPQDGVYVYFRYNDDDAVMVVLNNNKDEKTIEGKRFSENLNGFTSGTDILHRTYYENFEKIIIPGMSSRVILLN